MGIPCSHCAAAPVLEMVLGTLSCFPNRHHRARGVRGQSRAAGGAAETAFPLSFRNFTGFLLSFFHFLFLFLVFFFSFFCDKWFCAASRIDFIKNQITVKAYLYSPLFPLICLKMRMTGHLRMVLLLSLCCWGRLLTVSEPPSAPAMLRGGTVCVLT